jgi:hypothetical protein
MGGAPDGSGPYPFIKGNQQDLGRKSRNMVNAAARAFLVGLVGAA